MNPLVSVIMPAYNAKKYIHEAIESVINQTYQNWEMIIVDNCSTDNCKEIVTGFIKKDNRIRLIELEYNSGGPARPRNIGLDNAKGEYVAFLDADDEWHQNKLEIQYKYIKKLNAKFISCEYTYNTLENTIVTIDIIKYTFKDFLFSNRTSTPCTIIQRDLFNQVNGFQENQRYSEDYYLWLRASYITNLYKLNVPLVKLYKSAYGENGLSAQLWKMEKGELHNYVTLYHLNLISLFVTIKHMTISFLKFLRRYVLVTIKRNNK